MTAYPNAEGGLMTQPTADVEDVGHSRRSNLSTPSDSGHVGTASSSEYQPLLVSPRSSSSSSSSTASLYSSGMGSESAGPDGRREDARAAVSWSDLPKKQQLVVLTLARLSEPLVQTSLQSYMFYQLKWFDPTLPDSVISSQAGVLHASFTAAQFLTAMLWGRIADSSQFGRKTVLLIGLGGTLFSCVGFGFSTSFWQALVFRTLGGVTNGNVGVLRTMISEIVKEKKYQSRAFLLLPMTYNIGVIIGPILGGILSDLAGTYPEQFGKVEFFRQYPYAAPNLLSAFFLFSAMASTWLFLDETLDTRLGKRDIGRVFGRKLGNLVTKSSDPTYTRLPSEVDPELEGLPHSRNDRSRPNSLSDDLDKPTVPRYTQRLPFGRIFTRNLVLTLLASFIVGFHIGTFNSLWFVFLSTPVYDPSKPPEVPNSFARKLPFIFTGGIGLQPREVGMAMAILGVLGISLQLTVYPWLSARLGTIRSWRIFLLFFPFTYFLVPFLSLVPSSSPPPQPKDGIAIWISISVVLGMQVIGRTFALPAQVILVNNCTPHPSVLGTVHGIGQSISSLARTVGPILCGFLYGASLDYGIIGAVWWFLGAVAIFGCLASLWVWEGDGHEIWLEGDDEGR